MTVRDPSAASRRWTRWDSGTDGDSPEERLRAGRAPSPASSRCVRAKGGEVHVDRDEAERTALRRQPVGPSSARTSPNPPVGAVVLDRDGAVAGSGATAPAGRPARRGPRPRRGRRPGPRRHRRRDARAVPATPAGPARAPRPCSPPASPGSSSRAPTRPRWPAAAPTSCAPPVSRSSPACSRTRSPRGPLEAWLHRPAHRPPARHLEVRRDARRPLRRRRRHQPLDHRRAGRARTCTGCGPSATPCVVGIGTVLADDPAADRPARTPGTSRCASCSTAPADARPAPACAPSCSALGARHGPARRRRWPALAALAAPSSVLLEGGPTLAGAFLRAGLVDRVVAYVAPVLLGRARRRGHARGGDHRRRDPAAADE